MLNIKRPRFHTSTDELNGSYGPNNLAMSTILTFRIETNVAYIV